MSMIDYDKLERDGFATTPELIPAEQRMEFEATVDSLGKAGLKRKRRCESENEAMADLLRSGGERQPIPR